MIYTAEEIGGAKTISSISFLLGGLPSTAWQATEVRIYMGHTSLCGSDGSTSLSTTDWVPSGNLTQVWYATNYTPVTATTFTNDFDNATNYNWVTINLNTSFSYNGTDNLCIVVSSKCTTYQSGLTFKYIIDNNSLCIYRRNDSDANYANHPGTNSGTTTTYRPIIKFSTGSTVSDIINIKKTKINCGTDILFYDEGGDGGDCSSGDVSGNYYTRYSNYRHIFTSTGSAITATFQEFCTESASYDWMNVYNGYNVYTNSMSGNLGGSPSTMPGPYTSTGQSMTFTFRADVSNNRKGWKIRLSCPSCTERTLSFGSSPTSVSIGSSITCVATPSAGGGTVSYTASPAGIVNVTSAGVVTGVSVGTATITATIPASGSYCGATQTHTVTVVVPAPNLQQTNEPRCGIENVTLQASMPGGINVPTGYAYYWYSNAACTSEITSEVSGPNNNTLSIASVNGQQVWCRLEKRVASTTTSSQTFSYTGAIQTYTIPSGTTSLTLEVWGAQGGSYYYSGGYGGYSKGVLNSPTAGTTLYVVVGGQPTAITTTPTTTSSTAHDGGYNGGGNVVVHYWHNSDSQYGWTLAQGGGGATHIATETGLLSSLSAQQDRVLIVAGGGSGSVYCYGVGSVGLSGYAGFNGYAGGGTTSAGYSTTYQATQTTAGTGGSFGQGAHAISGYNYRYGCAGGGGGWYGGGANSSGYNDTYSEAVVRSHGGGSGYIKSTLTNTSSNNGSRSGHGQAKITASIPTVNVESYGAAASITVDCFTCTEPNLTYNNTTPSFTYGSQSTYTNTLTNPNNVSGITYSIVSQTTVDGSGNVATINASNGQLNIAKAGTVTVRASYAGGGDYCSDYAEYTLTVNCPTISAPSVTDGYRCEPGTVDLSATPGTGTGVSPSTCHWYIVPSGGSAIYTGTAITTPSISATTSYYVATYDATSGCESSTRTRVYATIYNSTISYTGLSNPYAEGATVNITLTSDYTSYTWTSNYGGSGSTATVTGTAYPGLEFHATASEHGCNASVDIPITVIQSSGGQACGVIYCSNSGNDSYDGTSTQPVKTLAKALTLATGGTSSSPVVIRMASGTYNINAPVNLISNVIIDGQWTANTGTGVWTKGTTATTINRTASSPEGCSESPKKPRITAIEGSNESNFILQDLTIQTADAPGYTSGTGYYGVSTYAVHLNGCSAYKFVRCKLLPGNASAGKAGDNGSSGTNGGNGGNGCIGDASSRYLGFTVRAVRVS